MQRPVLPPGSLMPVHPVGFLVITRERVYGVPVAQEFQRLQARGKLTYESFGLSEEQSEGHGHYAAARPAAAE